MNHSEESIQKKLSKSYFLLVTIMLLITIAFILPTQLKELNNSLEDKISWTGYILSQDQEIIEGVKAKHFSDSLQEMLRNLTSSSDEIDYIVFADTDSIRIFHPNSEMIGQPFAGNDEKEILTDPTPYITTQQGVHNMQKRSFHQIQDTDGTTLGFVMVSASFSTVRNAQLKLIVKVLLIFLVLIALGILFAAYTASRIRRSLLGYEPAALVKLFQQRDEILENIEEGILVYDFSFQKIYNNGAAEQLLGKAYDLSSDTKIYHLCKKCLSENNSCSSLPYEYNGKTLLLSILPLLNEARSIGFLLIFRDRTEILELADQLTGTTHIVDALRASTHEFLNKLHIISGMLQMGNYEQAIAFIDGLSNETRNSYQAVIQQIHNKTIAALLLGKHSHAKELNIDFIIQKDSSLDAQNHFLSTKELVTIIGNLIENAFHAVEPMEQIRQVQFFIKQTEDGLTIISDDTGCGMTPQQIQELLNGNFTTRGAGHGVGFRLIQEIINKHNGYLYIDSEPNVGSTFTISIQKQKGGSTNDKNSNC